MASKLWALVIVALAAVPLVVSQVATSAGPPSDAATEVGTATSAA